MKMTMRTLTQAISLLLCGLLASPLSAASEAAVLGQIISGPRAAVNGVGIPSETTLFSGDRLSTGAQGWARVLLSQGRQIHLGAESAAQARRSGDDIAVELEKGRVTLQAHANNDIVVYSNGLEVGPTPTGRAVWEVTRLSATLTRVATYHGSVEVRALNRTLEVPAGRSLELETKLVADGNNANDEEGSAGRAAVILLTLAGVVAGVLIPIAVSRGEGRVVSSPTLQ